jgi:hypothetical protein
MASRSPDIRALIAQQLDRDYVATVGQTLTAIRRDTPDLTALQQTAQLLEEQGAKFNYNDPVLRTLRADFNDALARHTQRIDDVAIDVQEMGILEAQRLNLQKALLGVPSQLQPPITAAWNNPDPAAVAQVINYSSSPAFTASLNNFQEGISGIVQNIMLQGAVSGWGPMRTSAALQDAVSALPAHYANSLMRSIQLTSYREATVLNNVANSDIIEGHIRIAALDERTCAACISLHGTFLLPHERVDDHRMGRCDSIPTIRGRGRDIPSGEDWFNGLSPDEQEQLAPFRASPAKLKALRDGAIKWPDFVQKGEDTIFGNVVSEASLKGMLGKDAQKYYVQRGGRPSVPPPVTPQTSATVSLSPQGRFLESSLVYNKHTKAIDNVLQNTGLSDIPVFKAEDLGGPQGGYLVLDGIPQRIQLKETHAIIHEYAHFLDHVGLGNLSRAQTPDGEWGSVYESANAARGNKSVLSNWWNAITQTDNYRNLQNATQHPDSVVSTFANYAAEPKEIWARAFDQYIVTKSGDAEMQALFNQRYEGALIGPFTDAEFAPIAREMDSIFQALGMLK